MSGQLYTTHLLSLEALLTVIDSIEGHCQAKVVNGGAHQEPRESVSGEGISSAKDGSATSTRAGRRCAERLVTLSCLLPSITPLPAENTPTISNGLDPPGGPAAPGQQMPEKTRPSRQDPGDGDAGEPFSLDFLPLLHLALSLMGCCDRS